MNAKEFIDKYKDNLSKEERTRQWAEQAAILEKNEEPVVAALTAAGWPARVRQCDDNRSVWDLVNTAEPYPQLLDTLAEHVKRPYLKRIREGIARALAVREARDTYIPRVLMDELKKETDPKEGPNSFRWVLINTLVAIGDSSIKEEVQQLLDDPRYASVKQDLRRLVKAVTRASRSTKLL